MLTSVGEQRGYSLLQSLKWGLGQGQVYTRARAHEGAGLHLQAGQHRSEMCVTTVQPQHLDQLSQAVKI